LHIERGLTVKGGILSRLKPDGYHHGYVCRGGVIPYDGVYILVFKYSSKFEDTHALPIPVELSRYWMGKLEVREIE
jgi:hypothetical protein